VTAAGFVGGGLLCEHSQCTHKGPQFENEAFKNPHLHEFISLPLYIEHKWNFTMYCRNIQYAYIYICLFTTIQMYGCLNIPFAKC